MKFEHKIHRKPGVIISLLALFIILAYGFFQARNLLIGPQITITEPSSGTLISDSIVEIKGRAKNIAYIKLNDHQIYVDDLGYFNEKLIAFPGYNIIKLSAQDKFGRTVEKYLEIVYQTDTISTQNTSELSS